MKIVDSDAKWRSERNPALPERLKLAKENITDCKGFIVFFFPLYSTLHIYTFTGCHKLSETK